MAGTTSKNQFDGIFSFDWNLAIESMELACEQCEGGEIDIDELGIIYEHHIQSLLDYVKKLKTSKEKLDKQTQINSYLTAFEIK